MVAGGDSGATSVQAQRGRPGGALHEPALWSARGIFGFRITQNCRPARTGLLTK